MNTSESRSANQATIKHVVYDWKVEAHSFVPHLCTERREETIDLASSNGSPASTAQFTVLFCTHREQVIDLARLSKAFIKHFLLFVRVRDCVCHFGTERIWIYCLKRCNYY